MACLQASNALLSSSTSSCSRRRISAALSGISFSPTKQPRRDLVEEQKSIRPVEKSVPSTKIQQRQQQEQQPNGTSTDFMATSQLFVILEAVADRVEMHKNIGHQRDNWNTLLLNSTNMITLTAATMAGVAATVGADVSLLAFKLSSTLLFSAATGIMVMVNKIQPSQLAEEQRNAARLFKQLQNQIQTILALRVPSQEDVKEAMEKVLAIDKAYPLPLLGKMIEKFPKTFEPAVWWTSNHFQKNNEVPETKQNGWSEDLEGEMTEIIEVMKRKDSEDYMRLGNLVLKINKILAISGPLLAGIAAVASALVSHGSWAAVVAVAAGALASTVNTLEHGGQVGMVLEMYRNCAGFFKLMGESIESNTHKGSEVEKRENGGMFEMNLALQLGRSTSELRDLAKKSSYSRINGAEIDEFASKLF